MTHTETKPQPAPIKGRFITAASGTPPTEAQKAAVAKLRDAVVLLAEYVDEYVPDGRNKAIALTSLEDVQMRANRGIFADLPFR
jgi:hypothetical protein